MPRRRRKRNPQGKQAGPAVVVDANVLPKGVDDEVVSMAVGEFLEEAVKKANDEVEQQEAGDEGDAEAEQGDGEADAGTGVKNKRVKNLVKLYEERSTQQHEVDDGGNAREGGPDNDGKKPKQPEFLNALNAWQERDTAAIKEKQDKEAEIEAKLQKKAAKLESDAPPPRADEGEEDHAALVLGAPSRPEVEGDDSSAAGISSEEEGRGEDEEEGEAAQELIANSAGQLAKEKARARAELKGGAQLKGVAQVQAGAELTAEAQAVLEEAAKIGDAAYLEKKKFEEERKNREKRDRKEQQPEEMRRLKQAIERALSAEQSRLLKEARDSMVSMASAGSNRYTIDLQDLPQDFPQEAMEQLLEQDKFEMQVNIGDNHVVLRLGVQAGDDGQPARHVIVIETVSQGQNHSEAAADSHVHYEPKMVAFIAMLISAATPADHGPGGPEVDDILGTRADRMLNAPRGTRPNENAPNTVHVAKSAKFGTIVGVSTAISATACMYYEINYNWEKVEPFVASHIKVCTLATVSSISVGILTGSVGGIAIGLVAGPALCTSGYRLPDSIQEFTKDDGTIPFPAVASGVYGVIALMSGSPVVIGSVAASSIARQLYYNNDEVLKLVQDHPIFYPTACFIETLGGIVLGMNLASVPGAVAGGFSGLAICLLEPELHIAETLQSKLAGALGFAVE